MIGIHLCLRGHWIVFPLGIPEYAGHGIVVLGGDGVELVIVTAGAGRRETEQPAGQGVHAVREGLRFGLGLGLGIAAITGIGRTDCEKPGAGGVRFCFQQISGNLPDQELIVRQVCVEGTHYPVAVPPGIRQGLVAKASVGIAVTCHVQPMAGPTLAVLFRFQKRVHYFCKSVRRFICQKILHLFRGRRQPGQVQPCPSEKDVFWRRGIGLQARCFQFGEDEKINFRVRPCAVPDFRQRGFHDGPECPVFSAEFRPIVGFPSMLLRQSWGGTARRPGGSHFDPCRQQLNLRIRELCSRGHGHVLISVMNSFHEEAIGGITRS